MKTTKYVCKNCGKEFCTPKEVYNGDRVVMGCPGCSHCGAEEKTELKADKFTLGQYLYLKRELEMEKDRLNKLKEQGKDDSDLYELIENNKLRVTAQLIRTQSYIYSIDDSFIRQIFVYRYINGLTWTSIAVKMGGYCSSDYIRIAHDRFLKSGKSNSEKM